MNGNTALNRPPTPTAAAAVGYYYIRAVEAG
jgi:hypothetical protein